MDIHQLSPELQALLRSPEAQQLRQLLSRGDSRSLDAAASAARSGDGNAARAALSPLLDNPEAAELLLRGAVYAGVYGLAACVSGTAELCVPESLRPARRAEKARALR